MSDIRVAKFIVPDDGSDGIFWRNGERWIRERGAELRLFDIAPRLESSAIAEILLRKDQDHDATAMRLSRG